MSANIDFNGEYMLESDEGSPLPMLDSFSDNLDTYDHLHFFNASHIGQHKAHFHSSPAIPNLTVPKGSPPSPESISDSSSSKRTGSTLSAITPGDIIMSDGHDVNGESWAYSDLVNDDDEGGEDAAGGNANGTINPSALEAYGFAMDQATTKPNSIASASNTPSPFDTSAISFTPEASLSPRGNTSHRWSRGHAGSRGHSKTPSHNSASKPTPGSATNGVKRGSSGRQDASQSWNMKAEEAVASGFFQSSSPSSAMQGMVSPGQMSSQGWQAHSNNAFAMQQLSQGAWFQGLPMQMPNISPFNFQPQLFPHGSQQYKLRVTGVNSKSRVETQIRVKIILAPLPQGVRRLHLPTHTISKPKLLAKPTPQRNPDMLELHTALYCTSALQDKDLEAKALERSRKAAMSGQLDPLPKQVEGEETVNQGQNGSEVHICNGCVLRERKRASRKKLKKPEDDLLWAKDEERRIVVFNSQEIRNWEEPNKEVDGYWVDCQMRIACYCRHHAEKLGFTVIFTITDFQGNLVGQAMSSSIMITDDHKTHGPNSGSVTSPADNTSQVLQAPRISGPDMNGQTPPGVPIRLAPTPASSDVNPVNNQPPPYQQPTQAPIQAPSRTQLPAATPVANSNLRLLSRPASPTSLSGPSSKKRKASNSMKVPSGLSMTRIDTGKVSNAPRSSMSPHPQHQPQQQQQQQQQRQTSASNPSATTSPSAFSPIPSFQPSNEIENMFAHNGGPMPQSFAPGPLTPNGNEPLMFIENGNGNGNRGPSYEHSIMGNPHMYSAPASAHASRAPSPRGFRNPIATPTQQQQNGQFQQALVNGLYNTMPMALSAPPQPTSVIHKIIPAEGPRSGGIEVTILGSGFQQGVEVMFGDTRATTTTYWGESSLVCLLPPSPTAGNVLVTLKLLNPSVAPQVSAKGQPTFRYTDDDEQQLMRTALTVLGLKMSGKAEDVSDIARRIIGNMEPTWDAAGQNGQRRGGGGQGGQFNNYALNSEVEGQLLKVLELIDLDDSPRQSRLNLRRSRTGQTMLHLACSLGLSRFVAGLLARGALTDLRDKGGYTALHLAALNNHTDIVRRLVSHRADPTLRTLSGLTAADVARSHGVVQAIQDRHTRSRSVGSLYSHSRTSSMTSLRSQWAMTPLRSNRASITAAETDVMSVRSTFRSDQMSVTAADSGETSEESLEYSGEESPEYSSGDMDLVSGEDDQDDEHEPWARSRRSSAAHTLASRRSSVHEPRRRGGVAAGLHSPAAAVTAFKDQMSNLTHNFQQAMALHLQNMSQFPYLPQMPAMAPLTDYQAYLNSAAVFQRLASMVPNMPNIRPGSAGEQQPTNQGPDGKWWDMSTLAAPLMGASSMMMGTPTPPPAYEEIYPQTGDLDKKQASAAGAAAEAEADQKCAALYDQQEQSSSTSTTTTTVSSSKTIIKTSLDTAATETSRSTEVTSSETGKTYQLPALLQIGRKNAITREQRENLQRARAEKLKTLSRDRYLFFVWIPLLLVVLGAMLYSRFPYLPATVRDFFLGDISNPFHNMNLAANRGFGEIGERLLEVV